MNTFIDFFLFFFLVIFLLTVILEMRSDGWHFSCFLWQVRTLESQIHVGGKIVENVHWSTQRNKSVCGPGLDLWGRWYCRVYITLKKHRGWAYSSSVESENCSSRGPKFLHLCQVTHNLRWCLLQRDPVPLASVGSCAHMSDRRSIKCTHLLIIKKNKIFKKTQARNKQLLPHLRQNSIKNEGTMSLGVRWAPT